MRIPATEVAALIFVWRRAAVAYAGHFGVSLLARFLLYTLPLMWRDVLRQGNQLATAGSWRDRISTISSTI